MRNLTHDVFKKNTLRKIALAFMAMTICTLLSAQSKTVDKANDLFKNNQFADAAVLYRQALTDLENEGKQTRSATLLKSKLAYCYRMNNKMDKAEELYAEVVKDESAKAETYYYYGEALMSNGKYGEAKKWFTDYQKLEPTDEKVTLMLRACDYAPLIQPYFQYLDIQEFAFNSDADDNAPVIAKGGLIFSSDRKQGVKLLKEKSGWTGRDYLNLYFSPLKSDGSFAEPGQFSSKLSEVNKNTGNATLTADESEIFFTRNDNELNKQNTYSLQLFSAKSAGESRWKDVEKLPFCSSNFNFMHPAVSPDGRYLFFASNRAGGFGGTDLWVSERMGGEWNRPENLGPAVNTTANEGFPFVGNDGKLYFCSKGHPGFGGFDIFVTYKDENGAWAPATNLGKPINSPLDDISIYVSSDQKSGYFTSSRSGGDDDIFIFRVLDEAPSTQPATEPVIAQQISSPTEMASPTAAEPILEEETQTMEQVVATTTTPEPSAVILEEPILETQPQKVVEEVTIAPREEVTQEQMPIVEAHSPLVIEKEVTVETVEQPATTIETELPTTVENFATIQPETPIVMHKAPAAEEETEASLLSSFKDLSKKLNGGTLAVGERFRLNGAVYDPIVWQLTPRVTGPLDSLVSLLKQYPSLQIELSAHTESLGGDEENLRISENRASTALDYVLREGIAKERVIAKGCGETMPLNNCRNGIFCTMEEHLVNQRLEVKVLTLDGKW